MTTNLFLLEDLEEEGLRTQWHPDRVSRRRTAEARFEAL